MPCVLPLLEQISGSKPLLIEEQELCIYSCPVFILLLLCARFCNCWLLRKSGGQRSAGNVLVSGLVCSLLFFLAPGDGFWLAALCGYSRPGCLHQRFCVFQVLRLP